MNSSRCNVSPLSADAAFGPIVRGCRFDFTFTFEQYFFSIVPSVVFLLLAPIRINTLRKRKARVQGQAWRSIKLSAIAIFVALQLITVILWATGGYRGIRTPAVVAWSLSFIAGLALFALSYLEHSKSLRPSALLNLYLFFTVLFDAVVVRTLWTFMPPNAIRDLFTASFALKCLILLLEAKEKRNFLQTSSRLGPEETSGLYSQTFLWWLNRIIIEGYRHILKPIDLYPVDESMSSEVLNEQFWVYWSQASKTGKPRLTRIIFQLLKWPLLLPVLPRIALLGFTICQPLMVSRLLGFLQNKTESVNNGYGLIGAYAVVYFGMSVSNSLYEHRLYRFLTMLRGALVTAIFTKTTELSITALDNSAAVTLMSTDVERLILGLRGLHDLWANMLQLGLATGLLSQRLGWACVGPIVVVFIAGSITMGLAFAGNIFNLGWIAKIQRRVGITSNILGHMKGVKMSGLAHKMTTLVQNLRVDELDHAKKFWTLSAITGGLAYSPIALSPVATFTFYAIISAKDGTTLGAPRLFTSLALLILLTQPLFVLFHDIFHFKSTFGIAGRIEQFLVSETRHDTRIKISESLDATCLLSRRSISESRRWQAHPDDTELMQRPSLPLRQESNFGDNDVVIIVNGQFGWKREEVPTLRDINLRIHYSELTLLIGPVASGKTTLLKAILGETSHSDGLVTISETDGAYCEQIPWLINASVKQNIVGFSEFNNELYNSVIHSCDLEQDIATFLHKDATIIGSNGISLSTGQKQRIAIARAVYSRKKFVILDDVFSSLDVNTQKNVFTRLFGPDGLLRRWKSTVLIATHAVNLLPFSDRVVALSADGRVAEQGTFHELISRDGYVSQFCLQHAQNDTATVKQSNYKAMETSPASNSTQIISHIALGDGRRQIGDRKVYQYFFRTVGHGATIVFITLASAWAFFTCFPSVWLKWYADSNATEPNKRTGFYLGIYAALQVTYLIDLCVLIWFSFNVITMRSGLRLHEIMLKTVVLAPMSFFSKTDIGSITTRYLSFLVANTHLILTFLRFSQDMQLLDGQLPFAYMIVAGTFLSCIGQIGLIASAAYYVSIAFPFLFTIYFVIQRYYLRTSRQMRFLELEEKAPVYAQFIESLSGLATIRAFSWQRPSIAENYTLVDKSQKPYYLMFMIQTWLTLVLDLITTALAVIVVAVSVKMRDSVSVGFTGVSLTQIISFTTNVRTALLYWTQMETSIGAVARVKQFEEETENENQINERNEPPPDWPSQGHIAIENLTVSYGTDSTRNALDNISLEIKPGEKFAIVGRTGSGKSTLLLALFRMVEISSGRILIDGLDISTIPRHTVRARLNAVGDDPLFLDGHSVRENVDPYDSSTDTQIIDTLTKVGLWRSVEANGGLEATFTQPMFSHGQRQVFSLARALLRSGNVVVLDEVSSSVDRETEDLMRRVMRDEFRGKTVVAIAHRVGTISDFDGVVVLGDGKVLEMGFPGELERREGGVLKGMVEKGL
ncbi:P-loop containing nucleoside triphosphate hydrolase protein [Lojkania enalia]|uniref:P-loop containing nucleoside triphosphate hydrolase protein n=1 Tax=Lojkania enalia TaxID=147567 RepID=A0A9P4JW31_9PLEO|nr:P-loop containing nucleoside triphosphate hydrolase protein [Didymosphaeria enalia]